jgi:hypothetical protein
MVTGRPYDELASSSCGTFASPFVAVPEGSGGQEQIRGMLTSRLATEFQGYSIALHGAAADHFMTVVAGGSVLE